MNGFDRSMRGLEEEEEEVPAPTRKKSPGGLWINGDNQSLIDPCIDGRRLERTARIACLLSRWASVGQPAVASGGHDDETSSPRGRLLTPPKSTKALSRRHLLNLFEPIPNRSPQMRFDRCPQRNPRSPLIEHLASQRPVALPSSLGRPPAAMIFLGGSAAGGGERRRGQRRRLRLLT